MSLNRAAKQPGALFRRSSEVTETRVTDRVILYHASDGGAFVLNPTASVLWDTLKNPCTVTQLAHELQMRFPGLASDRAEADIASCIVELQEHHLIEAD